MEKKEVVEADKEKTSKNKENNLEEKLNMVREAGEKTIKYMAENPEKVKNAAKITGTAIVVGNEVAHDLANDWKDTFSKKNLQETHARTGGIIGGIAASPSIVGGGVVGATIGTSVGLVGGPVGALIGAAVGGTIGSVGAGVFGITQGAVIGGKIGSLFKKKRKKKSV